jgi:diguanylate cyclase (GGDEF)-like protein/PAS domain S-box-containing protein
MTATISHSRNTQDLLCHLVDEAPMVAWETDLNGVCIYTNPAFGKFNLADVARFIHPEDAPRIARTVQAAKADRLGYQVEYRFVRSNGASRWIMEAAAPRFSAEGRLTGYLGTLVDVSAHYETRSRLARSETEHSLLTENARDLISHTDAEDVYVYASPSHKDTLGYEPHELVGTQLYNYIHPDDLNNDARPGGNRRRNLSNIRFRHKAGHWVWLGASTRTIRDPETGAKRGMVAIARDITAQLEAQRELVRREERFHSLIKLSSDWYWETDEKIRFTFFSEDIYRRFRVRPDALLGTPLDTHAVNSNDPGLLACMEAIATRRPFLDVIYAARLLTAPATVRFLRVSGEPVYENGEFCGYRGVSRDVTREVRTAKALEILATRDILTELPNRASLLSFLKALLSGRREDEAIAVLFIDLDNFKQVNDSLGHAAGDVLLKEIAARLSRSVRPEDIVARLGGDEFVVVSECSDGARAAGQLAEKLCGVLDAPMMIAGHEVKAGTSVGISMYPEDGVSSETLLQNADTALYRAKALGGNTFCFYTPEMSAASKSRLVLQAALRHALERDEFEVFYQPRVKMATMEIVGVEALLRWPHPDIGNVSPVEFIPLAEESGLIDEIGEWVLRHATQQAQSWTLRYGKPLTVSVNLSAKQLRKRKLLDSVAQALSVSGLAPEQLELELTESALMEDADFAAKLLNELKSLGLRLTVDDFGTGYSSLAYLCRFPLDGLKLDRSFLLQQQAQDLNSRKLAEAVINLAHTLNLSVVAEGVETSEHLAFLRTTACDEIQGDCISVPISAMQLEELLSRAPGTAFVPS